MTALLAAAALLAAPDVVPATAVPTAELWHPDARAVVMTVDGHRLRMLVDPKAPCTAVDAAAAARIGLTPETPVAPGARGRPVQTSAATVCRYALGGHAGGLLRVGVADLAGAGFDGIDGVLGGDVLDAHAARLDPATHALRVRPLAAPAARRLAGHWACVGIDTADGPADAARVAAVSLDFDGDRARFKSLKMDERYHFNADNSVTPARLVLYRDGGVVNGDRVTLWLCGAYESSGDALALLVSTADDPVWFDGFPDAIKPAGTFAVLRFKRTGPAHPVAAPPAPAKP